MTERLSKVITWQRVVASAVALVVMSWSALTWVGDLMEVPDQLDRLKVQVDSMDQRGTRERRQLQTEVSLMYCELKEIPPADCDVPGTR